MPPLPERLLSALRIRFAPCASSRPHRRRARGAAGRGRLIERLPRVTRRAGLVHSPHPRHAAHPTHSSHEDEHHGHHDHARERKHPPDHGPWHLAPPLVAKHVIPSRAHGRGVARPCRSRTPKGSRPNLGRPWPSRIGRNEARNGYTRPPRAPSSVEIRRLARRQRGFDSQMKTPRSSEEKRQPSASAARSRTRAR